MGPTIVIDIAADPEGDSGMNWTRSAKDGHQQLNTWRGEKRVVRPLPLRQDRLKINKINKLRVTPTLTGDNEIII